MSELLRNTLLAKRISCLASPSGSVGMAVCETCFYLSNSKASTLIGGKSRGYKDEKASMVVSRLCFHQGNWLVAQHTPSAQDTVSSCTNWISAGSYAFTTAETQQAVCEKMPLPATVLCKKDIPG